MMLKLLGFEFRVNRTGRPQVPPPDPVAPKPKQPRQVSAREAYHALMAKRTTICPVTGLAVRLAPPIVRVFVDAGLSLRARMPQGEIDEGLAEVTMEQTRIQARRLICAAAEEPLFRTVPGPGQFDINLLPDEDLLHLYGQLVDWGSSIFYGTHRAELDPKTDYLWIDKQMEALGLVDLVAQRYGVLPSAVEAMPFTEFARALAACEYGRALEQEAIEAARSGR